MRKKRKIPNKLAKVKRVCSAANVYYLINNVCLPFACHSFCHLEGENEEQHNMNQSILYNHGE